MKIIESPFKALPIPEDKTYPEILLQRCEEWGDKTALVRNYNSIRKYLSTSLLHTHSCQKSIDLYMFNTGASDGSQYCMRKMLT